MKKSAQIHLNIPINRVTHRQVKARAAERGETLKDFVQSALDAALKFQAPPRQEKR